MRKKLFGNICTLFALGNLSSALVCCTISKVLFKQKCTKEYKHQLDELSYNCQLGPVESISSYQEPISQFKLSFGTNKRNDFVNCIKELKKNREGSGKISRRSASCILHMNSITINTNETTELSHLYTISRQAPNITSLKWRIHNKCHHVTSFVSQFKHLEELTISLSSINLSSCEGFSFNGTQLTKLHINLRKSPNLKKTKFNKYTFSATFLGEIKNLKEFKLNCGDKQFEVDMPQEMFHGLSNLEKLALETCDFKHFSAAHFQELKSLKVLNLSYAQFDDYDWLRYELYCYDFLYVLLYCEANIKRSVLVTQAMNYCGQSECPRGIMIINSRKFNCEM